MTLSEIRRRIDALKRRFATRTRHHQAPPHRPGRRQRLGSRPEPPEPSDVIQRFVKAGCRLPTFGNLARYLNNTRRQGDVSEPCDMVVNLLPWIDGDRYSALLRWDLPPLPRNHALLTV